MKVFVDVGDSQAELGYKGITLHVHNNAGEKVGRLRIGSATVEWLPGKTSTRGRIITLERLIADVLDKLPARRS